MKHRTRLLLKREAFNDWLSENFGTIPGKVAAAVKAFEGYGIDRNSFYTYRRGASEPPVMFFYAVMSIAPETNMWSLLERVK